MKAPKKRVDGNTERLTAEYVDLIIEKANEIGLSSIALAQAFQHDCKLRQKDVIGEWVPLSEDGTSDVIHGDMKWLRGIRWSKIDHNTLRHSASKGGNEFEMDLRKATRVLRQFERMGKRWPCDATIIDDDTGLPYKTVEFRRQWRRVADAAGVPKHITNMNSHVRQVQGQRENAESEAAEADELPAQRISR